MSLECELCERNAGSGACTATRSRATGSPRTRAHGRERIPAPLRGYAIHATGTSRHAAQRRRGTRPMTATEAITELQRRLAEGLAKIDPHHRLLGRPVSYRVIDGQMLEITYRDVAGIADVEVNGVKRIIGRDCSCSVSPQTAEQISVRFVVSLK